MNVKSILYRALPFFALLLFACNAEKKLARKKHTYMESVYKEMKGAVNEAEVTILNDTVKVLFPEHLLFQKNESQITAENFPLMQRFAKALNKYNKTSILINGYTDQSGGEELNKKLSQSRADTARSVLERYEVAKTRINTWGRGIKEPIADNGTEEGRRKNRRVEFIMLYSFLPDPH